MYSPSVEEYERAEQDRQLAVVGGREVLAEAALDARVKEVTGRLEQITIDTQEQYDEAARWRTKVAETEKVVVEYFEPDRVAKKAEYDKVLADKKKYLTPLESADLIVKQKMTAFSTKQEVARREAQAKADAEARKRAEDDRLELAQTLSSMGRQEKAVELLDKRLTVQKVEVAPKVGRTQEVWVAKVTDLPKFLAAAAADVELQAAVTVTASVLALLAKRKKSMPGVEASVEYRPVNG